MCMVKAFSYGSGTWEIAEALEKEGVDYLAVAYTSEAIELREKRDSIANHGYESRYSKPGGDDSI